MRGIFLIFLILISILHLPLYGISDTQIRNAIHHKRWTEATNLYQAYREEHGEKEDLLTAYAVGLLEEGIEKDEDSCMLSLFGAGISLHESAYPILAEGMESKYPLAQLVALKFLSETNDDEACKLLKKGLNSLFLPIRLETLFILAKQGESNLPDIAETTMSRTPNPLHPLFPQIFAAYNSKRTQHILKKLLQHGNLDLQKAAVLSCAQYRRDDLLSSIRMVSNHPHPALQEACAFALGAMGDQTAKKQLDQWLYSPSSTVSLAAAKALYKSGERTAIKTVVERAQKKDLFAIRLLGEMGSDPTGIKTLKTLLHDYDDAVRINAALSLLELRDPSCLDEIQSLLIPKYHGKIFLPFESPGTTLTALKQSGDQQAAHIELAIQLREKALALCIELDEKDFLALSKQILASRQTELIPLLMQLLQNVHTASAITMLKSAHQTLGSPLIRNYSLLALYTIDPQPIYEKELKDWMRSSIHSELIQFRPLITHEKQPHSLTPVETARLLINAYEILSKEDAEEAISLLLEAIKEGHPKNRYALAGLLLRALG